MSSDVSRGLAPLLIMGSPRSGTTFLAHVVKQFLDIHICRDNGTLLRFHRMLPQYEPLADDANLRRLISHLYADHYFQERLRARGLKLSEEALFARVDERSYSRLVEAIFGAIAAEHGRQIWGYKRASFARMTGRQIDELFPRAKVVHIIRDARDVVLSMRRARRALLERSWHFGAVDWVSHVSTGRSVGHHLGPERYLEIRYERFLSEPAIVVSQILDFCGGGPDRDSRVERIHREIGGLVKSSNSEKWRQQVPPQAIRLIERVAGPLLAELGYPLVNPEVAGTAVGAVEMAWLRTDRVLRNVLQTKLGLMGRHRLEVLKTQWRARSGV